MDLLHVDVSLERMYS